MASLFAGQYELEGAIIRLTHPKPPMGYQLTELVTLFLPPSYRRDLA